MRSDDATAMDAGLIEEIRARFAHVDHCPFTGERVFFENAGGALTLKSVVETSARFAAIPDNQGRDNPASKELNRIIAQGRADTMTLLGASRGQVFAGESGTELLFRMISAAINAAPARGLVLGSTLEHPASSSAARLWAERTGRPYLAATHNDETGGVTAEDYARHVTPDVRVATIIHASPVTGVATDIAAISAAIRAKAPEAIIIVDGIQHAAHGHIHLDAYDVDGYAISPYKVFSRHGYGLAWLSDRLSVMPHNSLIGGPAANWELGTRDTGAYATFSDVVAYFDWLGGRVSQATDRRARIEAAAAAIHRHEAALLRAMIHGAGNLPGLANIPGVRILAGVENPAREGLVSITLEGRTAEEVVSALNARGLRTHARKADHYSGNVLRPLGLSACVRISLCHYNTMAEVTSFLAAMREIADEA